MGVIKSSSRSSSMTSLWGKDGCVERLSLYCSTQIFKWQDFFSSIFNNWVIFNAIKPQNIRIIRPLKEGIFVKTGSGLKRDGNINEVDISSTSLTDISDDGSTKPVRFTMKMLAAMNKIIVII